LIISRYPTLMVPHVAHAVVRGNVEEPVMEKCSIKWETEQYSYMLHVALNMSEVS